MALEAQEDSLNRVGADVSYTVTVIAGGGANTNARTTGEAFAEGATVTVTQGGVSTPATTSKGGVATFANLRNGEAVVTVEAEGFTTVTYTTSLGDNYSSNLKEDNVETTIPIFPTTIAGGASEVSGIAWAETNTLNDTPEFAEGAIVRATIGVEAALNSYGIYFDDDKGEIKSASYSGFVQVDTVDAEGRYSLVIPNGNADGGNGIPHTVEFLPFVAEQTYIKAQGDSLAVVTEEVVFGDGGTGSHIDADISGVYAVIDAPVNNAQGFELTAEAGRTFLDSDGTININTRGKGYKMGDRFNFAADADGVASYIEVKTVDGDGAIATWSFEDNGATYSSKPELSQDAAASGSDASFTLNFVTMYDIKVANEGSGYYTVPKIAVSTDDYSNGKLFKETRFIENAVGGQTYIVDGKIKSRSASNYVHTVISASMPTFTVMAPVTEKAEIQSVDIATDGTIIGISLKPGKSGKGYTSQPTVTIKTVGEGMGSGATAIANVDIIGGIQSISIVNPGSGYMDDVNDASYSVNQTASQTGKDTETLKPGAVKVNHNHYYGGGSEKE